MSSSNLCTTHFEELGVDATHHSIFIYSSSSAAAAAAAEKEEETRWRWSS
jgi:hypothetical protein